MISQGTDRAFARRVVAMLAACLGALALLPATGAADEAEVVYDPATVSVVDLQLPQAAIEALEADPQEVEVRLKGSASFRPLDTGKSAFKLKFPNAGPFFGLRKMTLNNMVEDPSMTHETLAFALHRALGVPASRTGFVYLKINGEHVVVYMDVENYDKVAMAKKLGAFDDDVQNVSDAENGADLEP